MPGRELYAFSLHQIAQIARCMQCNHDNDDIFVISLWKHELEHVIRDSLSRVADVTWFDKNVEKLLSEIFHQWSDDGALNLIKYFVTFPS